MRSADELGKIAASLDSVQSVHLGTAMLCQDCNWITGARTGTCELCGSKSLLSLANVLNRKTGGAHDEVL